MKKWKQKKLLLLFASCYNKGRGKWQVDEFSLMSIAVAKLENCGRWLFFNGGLTTRVERKGKRNNRRRGI